MKPRLLIIATAVITLLVGSFPQSVKAGSCSCSVVGLVGAPACVAADAPDICGAIGSSLLQSSTQTVQCTYYSDSKCLVKSSQLDPIGATLPVTGQALPSGSGTGSSGGSGASSAASVPPGFPQPAITIPSLNVKIPGLTDFVAPFPGACSDTLAKMGITSCKVFPWIGQYIAALYNFGVAIAAFLAVVMIMWGGFLYITASGISSQAEHGKSYIQGAFLGLVLVFSSYIILATINPALVKFEGLIVPDVPARGSVPVLTSLPNGTTGFEKGEDIDVDSPTAAVSTGASPRRGSAPLPTQVASPATAVTASGQPASASVALCSYATKQSVVDDTTVDNALCPRLPGANGTYIGVKAAQDQPNHRPTDRATPQMTAAIQSLIARINGDPTLAASIGQWQITEGWPPTVDHSSRCHFRGCAVDIKLTGAVTADRIAAMDSVVNAFKANGTFCYVLNEYSHQVSTTTGGNFHVESYSCP